MHGIDFRRIGKIKQINYMCGARKQNKGKRNLIRNDNGCTRSDKIGKRE